jgi:hypothetical protein
MGIVTRHLKGIIEKQIDQHGLVVWFDPDISIIRKPSAD